MARSTGTTEGDAIDGKPSGGSARGGSERGRFDEGWFEGDWEYRPLQLPGDVSRLTASVRLAIQAEYGGWELSRVRLYPGGLRKVWLRRRRTTRMLPELST